MSDASPDAFSPAPLAPPLAPPLPLAPVALCAAQPLPAQPVSATAAAAPDFVHLLPAGLIRTRDGRGPFHLADPAAVIARSLPRGAPPLPLDENHATDLAMPIGAPAPARGWIVELQARADGVWGRVEWTDEGGALVARRAYRHISPAIRHDAQGRVTHILRASLVNLPNLPDLAALNAARAGETPETIMDLSKTGMDLSKLRDALSLPEDADEAAILAAIAALVEKASLNAARPDPAQFVPIQTFQQAVAEANKLRQGISRHAAEEMVNDHIRKAIILPFMREWAIELCTMNAPSYEKFIKGVGPGFSHLARGSGLDHFKPPPPRACLTDDERAIARNLGHTDAEFAADRD